MIPGVEGRLLGAFPALPVPLREDKALDLDALGVLLDRLIDRGVRGVSIFGGGA